MKTNVIIALVAGLIIGIAGTAIAMKGKGISTTSTAALSSANMSMSGMDMSSSSPISDSSMSMSDMTTSLKGLTGDEFDNRFITEMITHHQGAIDMATLAKTQAKHQEIKDLANTIITAQTSEITQMQAWKKSWGY